MPELPTCNEPTKIDLAAEVRILWPELPNFGLRKLAKMGGTSRSQLCAWTLRQKPLRPAIQRKVQALVRAEFAKHAARVAQLAAMHHIDVGA